MAKEVKIKVYVDVGKFDYHKSAILTSKKSPDDNYKALVEMTDGAIALQIGNDDHQKLRGRNELRDLVYETIDALYAKIDISKYNSPDEALLDVAIHMDNYSHGRFIQMSRASKINPKLYSYCKIRFERL